MAQRLVELCTILIESAYGDLASQIFSSLARYGRSSLITLTQLTHIPASRLKTGLALLIQHHIVLHYTPDEESSNLPTFYQVDLNAAYNLLRAQKYASIVHEREGEAASRLVASIMELGHASVGDLEQAYDLTPASKRDSGIETFDQHMTEDGMMNGSAQDCGRSIVSKNISTVSGFHSTLRKLLDQGYLVKVTERSYVPRADYDEEVRKAVIDANDKFAGGRITGAKKSQEFSAAVNDLKRKWDDEDSFLTTRDTASNGKIKRSNSNAFAPSKKRVKINGDLPNGIHHEFIDDSRDTDQCVSRLPSNMFVRANFDKCTLILHNRRLEQMAHYYLGPVTGAVYGALLKALEGAAESGVKPSLSKAVGDEGEDVEEDMAPSASDTEVLDHLDDLIDLSATVKVPKSASNLPNGVGKNHSRPKVISQDPDEAELGIKVEKDSDDDDEDEGPQAGGHKSFKERNKRLSLLRMHLCILAEHPKRFLKRSYDSRASRVDVAALTQKLVQSEVDTMIGNRYSHNETRIIRLLREKGKLEEKSIQAMSMLRVGPLRMHLTFLQFAGICDSQELPKDATRQPNRMLHLWQFNEKRVVNQYLHRSYQGMSRALQRLQVEREGKFKAVIEKAERVDVKGREQELLNFQEKELLKEWREVEERILVQVDRLDDLVGVLRDFPGHSHSLRI